MKDIRIEKTKLREHHKLLRAQLSQEEKAQMDLAICQTIFGLFPYRNCDNLFVYVSKPPLEVGTEYLIQGAWAHGKKVSVPRCIPDSREMCFYRILQPKDLESGAFGVLEPNLQQCEVALPTQNSICVVPGISFDTDGYRLGYGKGYYDRFLVNFPGKTIGLCYQTNLVSVLPHGRFDYSVDWIVTEKSVYRIR